jgi:hypothetical protein
VTRLLKPDVTIIWPSRGKIAVLRYCRKKQHAPAGTYQRDFGPVED